MQRPLDDDSSLLCSCHEAIRYDVGQALHDYLRPLFNAVDVGTVASRSASTGQEEIHGETLPQSASSVTSYLNRRLSSLAAVSNLQSTNSNPIGLSSSSSPELLAQRFVCGDLQ